MTQLARKGAALALGLVSFCNAQEVVPLTPERSVDYQRIGDVHFSPDGSRIAFVRSGFEGNRVAQHVWILDLASGRSREVTAPAEEGRSPGWSPEWSPDGRQIAYLSDRAGIVQIYATGADPAPIALTSSASDVEGFHWSDDGTRIAFMAKAAGWKRNEGEVRIADEPRDLSQLWVLDVATRRARQVTDVPWRIGPFQWTGPERLTVLAKSIPFADVFASDVYDVSLTDGRFTLTGHPPQPVGGLWSSPDNTQLALTASASGGPASHDLFLRSVERDDLHDVTKALDRPIEDVRWQDAGRMWLQAIDGFHDRLYRLTPGRSPALVALPLSVMTFDVARDGRVAFVGGDFQRLPELYLRDERGRVRQLTHLQTNWDRTPLTSPELFTTPSFDSTPIEAALFKPARRGPAGKWPLVLLVHGGPAGNFSARYFWFNSWAHLLVEHGYAVLMVNPRGSTGYGEAFVKANRGDWGGGDYRDLMAVLDAVIARGEIDPERLGIGGWSYGAEMTGWAIAHTDRFKAAVAGGGVYDQAAEFGTEAGSAGDAWYFGLPWDDPAMFARNSPLTFVRNVHTPILLVHGEADRNNPMGQSQAFYRALKYLNVESQLVTYPGEPHLPRQRRNQVDILERMLAWFDSHLQE